MAIKNERWWKDGIQFECQGSGQCCTSHGEHGFVYVTREDREAGAKVLGITIEEFQTKYCEKTDGLFHLIEEKGKPDCLFLKKKRCTIYEGRPTQCRTWPFWPDHMGAKAWSEDVASFCPGVGKGKVHSQQTIEKILQEQRKSDEKLVSGG